MLGGHARRRAAFPGERVAVAAEAGGQRLVVEDRGDRTGEIGGIAWGMEQAGALVVEQFRKRPVP